jgi:beta-lactam-binding protein with PASTA domain
LPGAPAASRFQGGQKPEKTKREAVKMTVKELKDWANQLGLTLHTWAPGDGVTRYRFFNYPAESYNSGWEIKTVLGRKDAILFLEAYQLGLYAKKEV